MGVFAVSAFLAKNSSEEEMLNKADKFRCSISAAYSYPDGLKLYDIAKVIQLLCPLVSCDKKHNFFITVTTSL